MRVQLPAAVVALMVLSVCGGRISARAAELPAKAVGSKVRKEADEHAGEDRRTAERHC